MGNGQDHKAMIRERKGKIGVEVCLKKRKMENGGRFSNQERLKSGRFFVLLQMYLR